jgi:hypothetical protein
MRALYGESRYHHQRHPPTRPKLILKTRSLCAKLSTMTAVARHPSRSLFGNPKKPARTPAARDDRQAVALRAKRPAPEAGKLLTTNTRRDLNN